MDYIILPFDILHLILEFDGRWRFNLKNKKEIISIFHQNDMRYFILNNLFINWYNSKHYFETTNSIGQSICRLSHKFRINNKYPMLFFYITKTIVNDINKKNSFNIIRSFKRIQNNYMDFSNIDSDDYNDNYFSEYFNNDNYFREYFDR